MSEIKRILQERFSSIDEGEGFSCGRDAGHEFVLEFGGSNDDLRRAKVALRQLLPTDSQDQTDCLTGARLKLMIRTNRRAPPPR